MYNSGPPEMYDLKCRSIFSSNIYLVRFKFHIMLLNIQFFWNMMCQLIKKGNKGKQYNAEGEGVHF